MVGKHQQVWRAGLLDDSAGKGHKSVISVQLAPEASVGVPPALTHCSPEEGPVSCSGSISTHRQIQWTCREGHDVLRLRKSERRKYIQAWERSEGLIR